MLARSYRSIVLPPESLIKTIIALGLSVVNEKIDSFVIWPFCSKFKRVHKKELFKVESTTSEEGVSDTETSQTESSSVSENAITPSMWKAEDKKGNYAYLLEEY